MTRAVLATLALLGLALTTVACGHDVGDACKTSVDCDPNGTRSCDLSQPGGYCTVLGCDETSCPSGSTCIRTFPEMFLAAQATQCTPGADAGACGDAGTCTDGGFCAECDPKQEDITRNDCLADELCLDTGLCAKQSYEQRECAKSCSSNGDCRSGYECRRAGDKGSMVLATNPLATTSFCAPFVQMMSTPAAQ